jgi:hypothetical protein
MMPRRERTERFKKGGFCCITAAKSKKLADYFRLDLFNQLLIENTANVSMPHE